VFILISRWAVTYVYWRQPLRTSHIPTKKKKMANILRHAILTSRHAENKSIQRQKQPPRSKNS